MFNKRHVKRGFLENNCDDETANEEEADIENTCPDSPGMEQLLDDERVSRKKPQQNEKI